VANAIATDFRLLRGYHCQRTTSNIPTAEPRSVDTLIYIVAHASREAAKKNWEEFVADPAWHNARDESEAAGPIVKQVESVYVDPTDYSPMQ